jgi:hypothetical protein
MKSAGCRLPQNKVEAAASAQYSQRCHPLVLPALCGAEGNAVEGNPGFVFGVRNLLFFSLCPQAVLRVLCVSVFLSVLRVSAVKAFAFDSISNLKFPISNRFSVYLSSSVVPRFLRPLSLLRDGVNAVEKLNAILIYSTLRTAAEDSRPWPNRMIRKDMASPLQSR